ncbi:putative NBD/HSP70 family sugar kinase [Salana multivorans]|uniref:Putative NBD/HSP70 family sugar kinase n=1 Tax=Salana multivorans TaxID=120377 RepID=A0A3N2DB48_9MICO|nr:ROK family protein [Salana multivorans]ROR96888.1 putative NBD/HSP70 family sugar kinase [Salana multivorans]
MSGTAAWRGSSVARVADFNLAVLIDTIRRSESGLSRVELASATGLTQQAVSGITRRALASGLLLEGERQQPNGRGKPRTPLHLNPAGAYAVGAHIDPQGLTYVIADLAGRVVARSARELDRDAEPDDVMAGMAVEIDRLVSSSGIPRDRVVGVGVASPGPVDLGRGMIVSPPHLPRWRDVRVTTELARRTSLPVILDKDVAAAAVGERWAGTTMHSADSAFLYMSTGVGVGIVAGGSVLRGRTGNAGDVGHLSVDSAGFHCPCGLRGCLAGVLSTDGILADAVADGALPSAPATREAALPMLTTLVERYEAGSPAATATIERAAARLAVAIRTIANITDAQVVAIGGMTWARVSDAIMPLLDGLLAAGLARGPDVPLRVTTSAFGEDAAAIGTACLVLDDAFMPSAGTFAL